MLRAGREDLGKPLSCNTYWTYTEFAAEKNSQTEAEMTMTGDQPSREDCIALSGRTLLWFCLF